MWDNFLVPCRFLPVDLTVNSYVVEGRFRTTEATSDALWKEMDRNKFSIPVSLLLGKQLVWWFPRSFDS